MRIGGSVQCRLPWGFENGSSNLASISLSQTYSTGIGENMNSSHTAAPLPADAAQARGKIVDKSKLLRVLGIGFGLSVTLGGTIGAGIMRTPGEIAARLPYAWLIVGAWLIGGAYSLIGSFAMSELGAMIPRSGCYYVFVRRAFGDYAGRDRVGRLAQPCGKRAQAEA